MRWTLLCILVLLAVCISFSLSLIYILYNICYVFYHMRLDFMWNCSWGVCIRAMELLTFHFVVHVMRWEQDSFLCFNHNLPSDKNIMVLFSLSVLIVCLACLWNLAHLEGYFLTWSSDSRGLTGRIINIIKKLFCVRNVRDCHRCCPNQSRQSERKLLNLILCQLNID